LTEIVEDLFVNKMDHENRRVFLLDKLQNQSVQEFRD
jgi:hypothetical protein